MNNILTEENIKKLREELDYRMTVKRAEIAKDKLTVAAGTGVLTYNNAPDAEEMVWQVVKVYTLADGQKAVKVQRIK